MLERKLTRTPCAYIFFSDIHDVIISVCLDVVVVVVVVSIIRVQIDRKQNCNSPSISKELKLVNFLRRQIKIKLK